MGEGYPRQKEGVLSQIDHIISGSLFLIFAPQRLALIPIIGIVNNKLAENKNGKELGFSSLSHQVNLTDIFSNTFVSDLKRIINLADELDEEN